MGVGAGGVGGGGGGLFISTNFMTLYLLLNFKFQPTHKKVNTHPSTKMFRVLLFGRLNVCFPNTFYCAFDIFQRVVFCWRFTQTK